MKKNNFMPTIVLGCICLVSALLLSCINSITAPIIADRQNAAADEALIEVLPNGSGFQEIADISNLPDEIGKAWRADGGYVFQITYSGFNSGNVVMVGVDMDGKIVNTKMISYADTYKQYESKLSGTWNTDDETEIKKNLYNDFGLATSATSKSFGGFTDAMKAAINAYKILGGEEVDTRTPEQVFADNLNIALGTTGKTFKRWFATEALVGVNGIYQTDSTADGVVMLIGDRLVGLKAGAATLSLGAYDNAGTTVSATAEEKATAEAAYALYSATSSTEIEIPAGTKKTVLKVSVTATGNYVIDMVTEKSYSSYGEWAHGDGENIYFTVSITADGNIIDVITTKSSESKGFGDVCVKESFYDSIRGATREAILDLNFSDISPDDYEDQIPAGATGPAVIAGATFTTVYYQRALLDAFDVVAALVGTN